MSRGKNRLKQKSSFHLIIIIHRICNRPATFGCHPVPIVDHRTSLYDGQLEFADANIAGLITGGIRAATAKDVSGKKPCRVFAKQKLEVQQCTGGTLLNRTFLNRIRAATPRMAGR